MISGAEVCRCSLCHNILLTFDQSIQRAFQGEEVEHILDWLSQSPELSVTEGSTAEVAALRTRQHQQGRRTFIL